MEDVYKCVFFVVYEYIMSVHREELGSHSKHEVSGWKLDESRQWMQTVSLLPQFNVYLHQIFVCFV